MEKYVSIVVPYFNRINYLKELIESVHKYADMPFELIVHDDASIDGSTQEVFNMRDRMSTLIINIGHNLGISASVNRLISAATSEYIIFLNDDCAFVNPCFKNIVDILSRPYVGYIHVTQTSNPHMNLQDTKFDLTGIKSGSALAFRKSVWKEIGGWNENVFSGASDVAFMTTIFNHGYFATTPHGKEYAINLSYTRKGNSDSSMGMSGYDCSYPKIFNLQEQSYDRHCKIREEECNRMTNCLNNIPAGISNLNYWHEYMTRLLYTKGIDWDVGKIHGHDIWKDHIVNDNALKH